MFLLVQAVRSRRLRSLSIGLLTALCVLFWMPSAVWANSVSLAPAAAGAPSVPAYDHFLASAETLYDAVNKGNVDVMLKSLRVIEYRFRSMPMDGIQSVQGIEALAKSIAEMRRAVTAFSPDEQRWKSGAAALRLAADALARPDKPLWHQYRSILSEDIAALGKSLEEGVSSARTKLPPSAIVSLERLSQHYGVIRTAVLLKSEPSLVERSDSALRYAQRLVKAEKADPQMLKGMIPSLQAAMDGLFPGHRETATLVPPVPAPPWAWSAMMGSFIVTVLTWVGWRRYRVDSYATTKNSSRLKERQDPAERLIRRWKK